ncbi:hypothetical protein OESDEN_18288, partial [Oesophagostomum dentatum]
MYSLFVDEVDLILAGRRDDVTTPTMRASFDYVSRPPPGPRRELPGPAPPPIYPAPPPRYPAPAPQYPAPSPAYPRDEAAPPVVPYVRERPEPHPETRPGPSERRERPEPAPQTERPQPPPPPRERPQAPPPRERPQPVPPRFHPRPPVDELTIIRRDKAIHLIALNNPYDGNMYGMRGADLQCYREARMAGFTTTF